MEEYDFTIIEENWTNYDLKDGTKLRTKPFLLRFGVVKWNSDGNAQLNISQEEFKITWNVPKDLYGKPDPKQYSTDELTFNVEKSGVDFYLMGKKKISRYSLKTKRGKFEIGSDFKINQISKSSLRDEIGRPKYLIEGVTEILFKKKE